MNRPWWGSPLIRAWVGPFRAVVAIAIVVIMGAQPHAQDKGTILFVGSSIFHRWTQLTTQMAPLPVQNIAFDGAVTDDWNRLVDPSVIPLGTRMTIPGYGEGVAADTGGAIQGATIDLWFPTAADAAAWGRRTVTITLH